MSDEKEKKLNTLDYPKCVRCSCDLMDDFQLIFDDSGLELELQKLLAICFDMDIKICLNEIQALCDDCLNELIDTYDIIQKNEDGANSTEEIDKKVIKEEIELNISDCSESNSNINEDPLKVDDLKVEESVSDKKSLESSRKTSLVDNRKRTQQTYSIQNLIHTKKQKIDSKTFDNSENEHDITPHLIEDENEANSKETMIPKNFSKSKSTSEVEDNVENEEEKLLINDEVEDNEKNESEDNSITGKECGEEFHIDYLDDYDEIIDVKEYKNKVLQSKFQDVCFPEGIKCRLCPKLLDNHIDMMTHTIEDHCMEGFAYPCVIDGECESLSSQQDLSFHLVFTHYDLDALVIYCKCPECEKRFNNFPSYNKHCCHKQGKKNVSRTRVDCDQCGKAFTSNKRYRFHLQFHLEKRRPKACFICDKLFRDQDDFFEHVMYAHEKNIGYLCIRCDKSFTTAETYKNHENVHKSDRPYSCLLCSKSYLYKHYLSDHMITSHGAETPYKCHICGKFFITKSILNNHLILHNKGEPTEVICCNTCSFVAENEKEAENHLDEHKDIEDVGTVTEIIDKVYCCEYCECAYNTVETLFEHRTMHADKEYCCDLCSSTFREYREFKYHKSLHPEYIDKRKTFPVARYYVCDFPECKKSYLQWVHLRGHKKQHQNARTIKCPKCKAIFEDLSEFEAHMEKIHKGSDYNCQFCDKNFASKVALGVHISRKHDTGQYSCDVCDYSYSNREQLEKHKSELHKSLTCHICGIVLKTLRNFQLHQRGVHEKEKRYFCKYCNKGFFRNYNLISHVKTSHLLKKYKCDMCPYETAQKESLDVHIRAHYNEKPFTCELCKKGFRNNYSLKIHMKRHLNIRDFKCPYEGCEYAYVEKTILNVHIRTKHSDGQPASPNCRRKTGLTRSSFNVPQTDVFVDDDDGLDFGSDEEELIHSALREEDSDETDTDPDDSIVKNQNLSPAVVVKKNFSDHDYIVIDQENKNVYGNIIEDSEQ